MRAATRGRPYSSPAKGEGILEERIMEESNMFNDICGAVGGLAILIYGMFLAGQGLQGPGAGQARVFLRLVMKGRIRAALSGAVLAFGLQSSSATTAILLKLVDSSLVGIGAALAVVLGAGIGPALTVELLSFDPQSFMFLFLAIGVALSLATRLREGLQRVGRVCLGFSLLFMGMAFLRQSASDVAQIPSILRSLEGLSHSKPAAFLFSAGLTFILQSSVATLGMVMALVREGALSVDGAVPMVLGANVGTCSTALLASLSAGRKGRSVALAYLGFKLIGALVALPWAPSVGVWMSKTPGWADTPDVALAHLHVLFNVFLALAFLPWTPFMARRVRKLLDPKIPSAMKSGERSPDVVLKEAREEMANLAGEVPGLLRALVDFFAAERTLRANTLGQSGEVLEARVSRQMESVAQMERSFTLKSHKREARDLFRTAGVIGVVLRTLRTEWGEEKRRQTMEGLSFSVEAESEIRELLGFIQSAAELFSMHIRAPESGRLRELEQACREVSLRVERGIDRHMNRVSADLKEDRQTSAAYLDLMHRAVFMCQAFREAMDLPACGEVRDGGSI